MIASFLMLTATLASYSGGNTNEDIVRACVSSCYAYAETPSYQLKACIVKCQELAKP
jgi:hypothetical protein